MSISRRRQRPHQRTALLSIRRSILSQRRRLAGDDAGLGMTEIIVAIMVFAVIATTAAYGMVNALTLTQYSRSSETATSIASSDLDQMRLAASVDDSGVFDVLSTDTPIIKTVGGTKYSITRVVSWQTTDGSSGACGTGTGTLQYKNVTETVSWPTKGGGTRSVTLASAIAPLSNINSDTTGTIIVSIKGAGGQPVPGVTVSITPVSGGGGSALDNAPQNTDNAGCSFGLLVDPGTYKVTASLPGDVDVTQSAIATTVNGQAISVVAGQNQLVPFIYDQAATFPLTYPAGATLPTNLPISFYHATTTPATTTFTATAPPTSVNAFPWGDGYTIIGGSYNYTAATSTSSCLDTNPASWTTPRAGDGAVGVPLTPVAATSGAAPSTAVPLGTFTLSGLSGFVGKYITAVTSTPTAGDPGCNAGQTLTFAKIPTGTSSQTLALPYGTWKLYAGSTSGALTTALPNGSNGVIGTLVGGLLTSLGGGANAITLDPRVVPTP